MSIERINIGKAGRDEWLALRRQGIGGSDMGKLLGVSRWGTPLDVWLDKTGRAVETDDNESMWLGRTLEDAVARRYAAEKGVRVERYGFMLIDRKNRLVGNVDRLVAIEGKAAHKGEVRTSKALEIKTSGQMPWDELPSHYQAQVHTYMALLPTVDVVDVAALFYGLQRGMKIYVEERDAMIMDYIRDTAREFWERYVATDTPPPPESESDCRRLWQVSKRVAVTADVDTLAQVEMLRRIRAQAKGLEESEEAVRAGIMETMQEADTLTDAAGKSLVTWRSGKDRAVTDWQAVARELGAPQDLIDRHTTTRVGARVFRLS